MSSEQLGRLEERIAHIQKSVDELQSSVKELRTIVIEQRVRIGIVDKAITMVAAALVSGGITLWMK